MDDYYRLHNIHDPAVKKERFLLTLEGDARLWCSVDKTELSFAELQEEFVKHFAGITSYEANLQKFRSFKWNQKDSLELYKNKLLMLSESIGNAYDVRGEPSREFKTQYKLGLPVEVQRGLMDLTEDISIAAIIKRSQKQVDMLALMSATPNTMAFKETTTALGMLAQNEPTSHSDRDVAESLARLFHIEPKEGKITLQERGRNKENFKPSKLSEDSDKRDSRDSRDSRDIRSDSRGRRSPSNDSYQNRNGYSRSPRRDGRDNRNNFRGSGSPFRGRSRTPDRSYYVQRDDNRSSNYPERANNSYRTGQSANTYRPERSTSTYNPDRSNNGYKDGQPSNNYRNDRSNVNNGQERPVNNYRQPEGSNTGYQSGQSDSKERSYNNDSNDRQMNRRDSPSRSYSNDRRGQNNGQDSRQNYRSNDRQDNREGYQSGNYDSNNRRSRESSPSERRGRESTPYYSPKCWHCGGEHFIRKCPQVYESMKVHFQEGRN
jgi:hypothetical protein